MEPKALGTRLVITEGMTVEQVKKEGNTAQKAAICIFDKDANGVFDKEEASLFNNTRVAVSDGQARIYEAKHKQGAPAKLLDTVDLKKVNAEYEKAVAYRKECEAAETERKAKMEEREIKLKKQLAPYGIQPHMVSEMFDNAQEKTIKDKKYLVLTSQEYGYELTLPLDERFKNPSNIYALTGGEGGPQIRGVHGATLKQTKSDAADYTTHIRILDSDLTFIGKYGNADRVIIEDDAAVIFKTDDFADGAWHDGEYYELQPGKHDFTSHKTKEAK